MDAKTHFKKSAEQHQTMSDRHGNLADECEKAELDGMAKEHRALQKAHGERAAHYTAMHEAATRKSVEDEMNKNRAALEPTRVSAVVPDNPNLRAVPRFGQKPVSKTEIDEEFADLVKVADDRDEE